jgi:hypothetical protein
MNHRHRFSAHLRDQGAHGRAFIAEADSFIDAATRFAETLHVPEGEVSIVVTDCETGRERCFMLDLATGRVGSC